jgi:Tol biopolymer transport system component
MVADWGAAVRLNGPVNTNCPEDAIEISRDGKFLYFYFTIDVLSNLPPEDTFSQYNGTYRAERIGGPAEFSTPVFFDLGKGAGPSLNGALSFTPDGKQVYFHSTRSDNTGYQQNPPVDDFLDIYVADIFQGQPCAGKNPGSPINSIYPDGEHALHPDGTTLYFTSFRPGGAGASDIWKSTSGAAGWSQPVNLGAPINTVSNELQPAFTADGNTMYFVSDRDAALGSAIYRSTWNGTAWSAPEPVIKGLVGEPTITGDGKYLYFVHVLVDKGEVFDADIWYCEKQPAE